MSANLATKVYIQMLYVGFHIKSAPRSWKLFGKFNGDLDKVAYCIKTADVYSNSLRFSLTPPLAHNVGP